MNPSPKFQEEYSAKIPALTLLTNLGWDFINPDNALSARAGKTNELILKDVLRKELQKRRFIFAGKEYPLSDKAIDNIIHEVSLPALNEGLTIANERLYNHMLYGISVTEFINGKKANPTVSLIDWSDFRNNSFLFTEEYSVLRTNNVDCRRPDIICFVNGLPLVVIEAKRPDGSSNRGPTIDEGVSQHLRNQRNDEIPALFAYSQLLVSINGADAKYATQSTPAKFWAVWKEEDFTEGDFSAIKNKKLSESQKQSIFGHRGSTTFDWYEKLIANGELAVTGQDRLIISLLTPARFLELVRFYILFDKKAGKIVARHQQVFGIKRLIERVNSRDIKGARQGGVIWHTTGSGKSFTMVFLSKALILHDSLKQCRLIIVTDRVDLEDQLSRTFSSGGELASKKDREAAMATSGKRLAEQIGKGNERIIFSIINKFGTATKLPECYNGSSDLIVLVDEGHRTQGGENHIRMKQAMPNAAFVAFTGTPILKDDKTTNKFGSIVHAYTMQRAVEDGAVTPLLYEERIPDLDVNSRAIDAWFDRI
ncbi:MAG: HsdR family type I site-specific deoxyribonuclease, partial [Methylotenera sp.]|nr:HsdR family type I site-specific deoxyribonuclease [Methylotenera sp.]